MKIINQLGYKGYYLSRVTCGGKEHRVTELDIESGSFKIISSDALKGFDNLEHLSVPEGVTSLEEGLCAGMTKLKSVKLPESTLSIASRRYLSAL